MSKISLRIKMFVFSFILVLFSIITSSSIMIYSLFVSLEEQLGAKAIAIARTVAQLPEIKSQVGQKNGHLVIQPIAEEIRLATDVEYVVVFDMERIRYSHPSEDKIGTAFEGGDEQASFSEHEYISKAKGVLGYSIRAFVPIMDSEGTHQVGVTVVGIILPSIQSLIIEYINDILFALVWGVLIGMVGSLFIANHLKKQTLNLEPYEIARLVQERSSMMQAMDMGILATDEKGQIIFMNRLAKEYTACEDDSVHLSHLFPNTWLAEQSYGFNRLINTSLLCRDVMYLIKVYPINVKKRSVGSLITMTNRQEAHLLAEELTGIKTLVDALRAQNHEYMNQLHSIAGLIQLDRTEDALNIIVDEIADEQDIIQFLKDHISNYSVLGLLLGKRSRAQELNIDFTIDRNSYLLDIMTNLSSGDMVTLLGNLIENAFEACVSQERKFVTLSIKADINYLFIKVKDSGTGLTDNGKRIFEYGYSTKEGDGRGIGLALVKQIVESCNGRILIHSEKNKETIITIKVGEIQND
ncbi:sensor histidine kinase [Pseudogracilibacillus sp. SO30301A]|uniref:sensor histidine kinase n=1 Tax=Pseudogracilibacillus sp. SO30301A TaxID=3098291 RepID=UPI00300E5391